MDRFGWILHCFLFVAGLASTLDHSLVTGSEVRVVSGVLMLTGPRRSYAFNFTAAAEACRFKNVTIATRAQLQQALDRGLEACKYGWISEQVAVVPRLSSVSTCGTGKIGLVIWNAAPHQRFGAWCFNASDAEETVKTTTIFPQIHTTSLKPTLQRTTAFTTVFPSTTRGKPLTNPTTIPETTLKTVYDTSTLTPSIQTTAKPKTSAPPPPMVSTRGSSSSPSLLVHSSSTAVLASTDGSLKSSEPSVSAKSSGPTALSTALTVLCLVVLILSAGGAVLYKLAQRSNWCKAPQKDNMETEMWKQTSREEEEEEEWKYSSEVTLCVNPVKVD